MISITQQYVNDIGDSMKEIIITVKKNISADVTRIIEIRTFKKRGNFIQNLHKDNENQRI